MAIGSSRTRPNGASGGSAAARAPGASIIQTVPLLSMRETTSGSEDGTVKLWETATGLLHATLRGHTGAVVAVALSGDGGLVTGVSYEPGPAADEARRLAQPRSLAVRNSDRTANMVPSATPRQLSQ
jgi:WD40 repeat protein